LAKPLARIAAVGVLSCYGSGTRALAEGMRAGACPARRATGIGYPLEPPPFFNRFPEASYPPGEEASALVLLETVQQMLHTWGGDVSEISRADCALVVGSGGFLYASGAELYWRWRGEARTGQPFHVRGPSWGASLIAARYNMRGPAFTLSTGCSSSANALLAAKELIERGDARRAIVVGAEGLSTVTLSGFDSLMLLDPQGCRPFDRDRAGLQLGEAVAALLLERAATPASGAIVRGAANLCDTHHLTSASPDGGVMRAVMLEAIANAGVAPADIALVKAHGTGSVDSDAAEAHAIRSVFGNALPSVSAFKRYVGHTLGACGALETAAMIACFEQAFIPPAAGFANVDPELAVEPLRAPIAALDGAYLLNFFGFGGNYTSLVVEFRS
jgi:3-oxoacyl-[acyl-carrier-protein] synthase I